MLLPKGAPAIGLAMMSVASMSNAFQSSLQACPAPCTADSNEWTVYSSVDRIRYCTEPMLLDIPLHTDLEAEKGITKLLVCTANSTSNDANTPTIASAHSSSKGHRGISHKRFHTRDSSSCPSGEQRTISLDLSTATGNTSTPDSSFQAILKHTEDSFVDYADCDTRHVFGYYKGVAMGVYLGSAVNNQKTVSSVFENMRQKASDKKGVESMTMQRCNDVSNANSIIGVTFDTTGDLASVQSSVALWHAGRCADTAGTSTTIEGVTISETSSNSANNNSTVSDRQLSKRGDCETATVASGDTCASLAKECGISATDFTKYNNANVCSNLNIGERVCCSAGTIPATSAKLSKRGDCKVTSVGGGDTCTSMAKACGVSLADFKKYNADNDVDCNNLPVGQRLCCGAGTLPDITPKANKDGSCHSYKVKSNDQCSTIAAANGLKASDISDFNDGTTWGWFGCNNLQVGGNICLSKGDPPMPAALSNAQCGPQVTGTKKPTNGTALADLNQCPLNSCCDIWGQCGITPEYCTNVTGSTGNPGTAPKNKNGCISNCGTDIKKSQTAPAEQFRVGYYESWNYDRPCLNLRASSIDVATYTHIHWGFAGITDDFNVTINDTYGQWDGFKNLYGSNKILSFGGWGFSTSTSTYDKLREAMDPKNVDTFVDNIYNFVEANGLDGVDFDWEYPGEQDIPGIPKGLTSDGANYLAFLKKMKTNFPFDKTVSIAAPASYWYLKNFPIEEMSKTLDYIVYMTYDLHGQWDYGKEWTQEGCSNGNCLRSQVNLTETNYALAMITKAGVDSTKVMVGVASYGRSFGMADNDCTGPNCHYTGNRLHSTAEEGRCTKTAGIIAQAEIQEMITLNESTKSWYDEGSNSDIIVWNDTWAAYMSSDTMTSRQGYYKSFNFGGTIDWALDLIAFTGDDGDPNVVWTGPDMPKLSACTASYDTLEELEDAADSIPQHCLTQYTLNTLSTVLEGAMSNYTDLMNDGYDKKFKIYADSVSSNAGASVRDYVYKNGNKYFTCKVDEDLMCADQCEDKLYNCDLCKYFTGSCYESCDTLGCEMDHDYGSKKTRRQWQTISEPCPPDNSKRFQRTGENNQYESIHWTLVDDKADDFYSDLYTSTGIAKKYTSLGTYVFQNDCSGDVKDDDPCYKTGRDFNIPKASGYDADDVDNPKDTAKKGLDRSGNLHPQVKDIMLQINTDTFTGSGADVIDAISVPILMISSAVDQMSKVEKVAEQISAEEKKMKEEEIIGGFIAAILFLIPVAGEVLGTVEGLADMATVLSIAGTAADIGLGVEDIVKHPGNAALDIMNIVFDVGSLTSVSKASKAAKVRRDLTETQVTSLGTKVKSGLKSLEKVTGKCVTKE
ncbi:killer toxin alpha/beta [Penicillium angulare]|uniref:chitinase n=1 Tax=Penicillium angulare TaxID=116970 RepID=A0A9W9EG99_9EURO|nr:killer toxin alpha/beta [Penicillium angulare]